MVLSRQTRELSLWFEVYGLWFFPGKLANAVYGLRFMVCGSFPANLRKFCNPQDCATAAATSNNKP
jgi:hypothetical protein